MVRISKSRSPPPNPPNPGSEDGGRERSRSEEGPVVEKRQVRHSAARGVKKQGREPCRDLWCGSGEDKSRERRGGGWRCRDGTRVEVPRRHRWRCRDGRRRKRDGEDHKPECKKAVASTERPIRSKH
jgi:hypothetical protein